MSIYIMAFCFLFSLLPCLGHAAATLENPSQGSIKSGVGLISGWVCDADELEVSIDGIGKLFVPYGSERADTYGVCGDSDNGFGLLINYNELGDGTHFIYLFADGQPVDSVDFTVQTPGTNVLRGVSGQGTISLSNGDVATVRWEESTQGFEIVAYEKEEQPTATGEPCPGCLPELAVFLEEEIWTFAITVEGWVHEWDMIFSGVERYDGIAVMVGKTGFVGDAPWVPFKLGRTNEVAPGLPISKEYSQALYIYANGEPACEILSFDGGDLVRDSYGELLLPIISTITHRDGERCLNSVPQGGGRKAGELYAYPYE